MSLRSPSVNENSLMVVILSASEGSAFRFGDKADSSALPQNDIQEREESTPFSKERMLMDACKPFPRREIPGAQNSAWSRAARSGMAGLSYGIRWLALASSG